MFVFLNFFPFLVASSMGFKPFLAACHIFTICIVVCFCNVVANKVLSLSLSYSNYIFRHFRDEKICVFFRCFTHPISSEARGIGVGPMVRNLMSKIDSQWWKPHDPTVDHYDTIRYDCVYLTCSKKLALVISFESIPACDRRTCCLGLTRSLFHCI